MNISLRIKIFFCSIKDSLKLFSLFFILFALLFYVSGLPLDIKTIAMILTLNYTPRNVTEAIVQILVMLMELSPLMAFMELKGLEPEKKAEIIAKNLKDHIIIIGAGHLGRRVIEEAMEFNIPFVVVVKGEDKEKNEAIWEYIEKGIPVIFGDATFKKVLEKANIKKAKAIVVCVDNDKTNLIIAERAKDLNPDIKVIVRIYDDELAEAMRERGEFDDIISTSKIAYRSFLLSPFFDVEPAFTPIPLKVNKKLENLDINKLLERGISIIAIKRDGKWISPSNTKKLRKGDIILIAPDEESVKSLIKEIH